MILKVEDIAEELPDVKEEEIFAIEAAIRDFTNNHFHRENYSPKITKIEGKKVFFEGLNLFNAKDTAEIVGTAYFDGFYIVESVGDGYIELKTNQNLILTDKDNNPKLFQSVMPESFKLGVSKILKYQTKTEPKQGIKSETIARMSITYESGQDLKESINGFPVHLFSFCEPYIKMRC